MNNNKDNATEGLRSFQLLDEISRNESLTQRELSNNMGTSLGLVNSYLKNLISKGYITVSGIPRKRYRYYLTPKGFSEKARLAYHHLNNFTNIYRVARKDFSALFSKIENSSINRVAFAGVDEITEIAYLSLKEVGLELGGVLDISQSAKDFLGFKVMPLSEAPSLGCELIIITSFKDGEALKSGLIEAGISESKIVDISGGSGGWLKKAEGEEAG